MVHAFVFVKTGSGSSPGVLESIKSMDAIIDGHVVAGEFDLILEAEAEEVSDLFSIVSGEIQLIEGVLDTKTYIALE